MANTYEKNEQGGAVRHLWTFDSNGAGQEVPWPGGPLVLGVETVPTMGGGSLQFEWSPSGTFQFRLGAAISAAGPLAELRVPRGKIRPVLSGATTPAFTAVLA